MFELLIGGLVLYFGYHFVQGFIQAKGKRKAQANRSHTRKSTVRSSSQEQNTLPAWLDVPAMMERGDWDMARLTLQKMAYDYLKRPPEEKREFTELMKRFAAQDPLYRQCIEAVGPLIAAQPGIKQTALYDHMPTHDVEEARYVLYFAHELGHVVRRKKGNSYEVFLPGQDIPAPAVKRIRKKVAV